MDNVFEQVEKNIDNLVLGNADWTASATKEELEAARKGELHLRFWNGEVPREWLKGIKGKRVLAKGGELMVIAPAPINYMCDWVEDEQGGYYKTVHRVPCCTREYDDSEWIEYGHTMEEYLGGMIRCGFVLNGYMECQGEDITELNFLARAVKPE